MTGGLAAGKSTVARQLSEAGFLVVDADQLVAELYESGQRGAARVRHLFGDAVLNASGAVDHRALADIVFADDSARQRLEKEIHPLVRQRFKSLAAGTTGVAVLEGALLVEAGLDGDFDLLVTVEAQPELRIQRAVARGFSERQARRRVEAQSEPEVRIAAADLVLWNNGTPAELEHQADLLIAKLHSWGDDAV